MHVSEAASAMAGANQGLAAWHLLCTVMAYEAELALGPAECRMPHNQFTSSACAGWCKHLPLPHASLTSSPFAWPHPPHNALRYALHQCHALPNLAAMHARDMDNLAAMHARDMVNLAAMRACMQVSLHAVLTGTHRT